MAERRIEITATVTEAVASAFEQKKALPKEGSLVVLTDIAGARYVARYHRTRIRETSRHPN
jgi:siderophore synthetase component